jgi:hypothetical protein
LNNEYKSAASCHISDIQGIIYGGISSRFWMLRKHFASMKQETLEDLPFYSWQCLTLQLSNRDVDLVIQDEDQLNTFLKYIIIRIKTLNGDRDSAVKIIDLMQAEGEESYKMEENKQFISDSVRYKIRQTNEHNVYRKVFLKYLLLRIRSKISFLAFKKKMTIVELFSNTILKCWYDL